MKDFFISYNQKDRPWAEWIAVTLSKARYSLTIQAWDFLPGSNFVLEMQRATVECNRTVAVLSPDWLASVFTQPEWAAAFSLDPTGANRKLIPVRVRACEPPGLLRAIVYCDLVGRGEEDARKTLLHAISEERVQLDFAAFPGTASETQRSPSLGTNNDPTSEAFPGSRFTLMLDRLPSVVRCAFDLLGLLRTTRTTFEAQARLRDRLVQQIHERLILNPYQHFEYEEFFARYYPKLDDYERQVFATIRSFTLTILGDYNRRMLDTINGCPHLINHIGSVAELKDHLLLWLAKFDGTFRNEPKMSLLYVGVEEGAPFPRQVEGQIWQFLQQQGATDELLRAEPEPPSEFEEHSSNDGYWRLSLHRKWILKCIGEIEGERARVLGTASHTGEAHEVLLRQTLKNLDQQLAEVLSDALFPGMPLEAIVTHNTLDSSLQGLIRCRDDRWPADFLAALSASEAALAESSSKGFFWTFKGKLLTLLPILSFHVDTLKLDSNLSIAWQKLRNELKDWAIFHNTDRPSSGSHLG